MSDTDEITLPRETALKLAERARHSHGIYKAKKDLQLAELIEAADPAQPEVTLSREWWIWAKELAIMLWNNEWKEVDRELLATLKAAGMQPTPPAP